MDVEDEEFWNFGLSKQQKEVFKTKKHSYKSLDQGINKSYAVSYLTGNHRRTNKHYSKADAENNSPYFFIEFPNTDGKQGTHLYKTLLDSGTSSSVVNCKGVQHLEYEQAKITSFAMVAGQFYCTKICRSQIKMPELKALAKIDVRIQVTQMNEHYDIILGLDILTKLEIVLD